MIDTNGCHSLCQDLNKRFERNKTDDEPLCYAAVLVEKEGARRKELNLRGVET
jgi:hypothetical protein